MIELLSGPVLVLFSGGRDSDVPARSRAAARGAGACAARQLRVARRSPTPTRRTARQLCERLGVPLAVVRPEPAPGNVQAWARDVRYAEARRIAGGALIATGHTATDQIETVLYRLAASPGRRALLGMEARCGDVIRPLLEMTREETAAYCRARGLHWREDASNEASARGRIRATILPALRELHPAADENILRTLALLRDEAVVLDGVAEAARRRDLAALPPALARLVLQRLADEAAGGQAPAIAAHADAILALSSEGTAELDLPGGLRAVSEYGKVRIVAGEDPIPEPATLPVPGRVAYGPGEIVCERGDFAVADGTLAASALASTLEVRAWRPGDRMRPLGLGGSKSLQDLFTDRKVPRAQRAQLPVVVSDGEIAWVPGVATGERFRVQPGTTDRVQLSWRLDSATP